MQVVPRKFFALRAERIGAQGVYFFNGGTVMQEKIRELKTKIDEAVQKTETGRALYELKLKFQAELKDIMSGMRELTKEERPTFGKIVNEFKQSMEEKFEARAEVV